MRLLHSLFSPLVSAVVVVLVLSTTTRTTDAFSTKPSTTANTSPQVPTSSSTVPIKILVLGDTGFLGKEVVKQLQDLQIPYSTASRSTGLDLTSPNALQQIKDRAEGCTAVISTVGSLLGNQDDEIINAANGVAAEGAAQTSSVKRFVAIGNDPKVRSFSKNIPFLQWYAKGKETSEAQIKQYFPSSYTIIQPSLIHGGEEFSTSPPRIPSTVGQVSEDILGLYPFQAASEALPSILGIALQAPLSRERIARAAINSALGMVESGPLDSREAIVNAASKRPSLLQECLVDESAHELKQQIYALGDCGGDSSKLEQAFKILEKIERCNEGLNPSTDPTLNGRWDFCFDVEADLGTGVVKDILEGKNSPIQPIFDLQDLYMEIENNSDISIFVQTKILSAVPIELKLKTKIVPDPNDPTGTTFDEVFQGLELMGQNIPVPDDWQRSRPLEFSYLDETMLIARGNGGEPHYLKRD